jgi:thymidylate synthase (FAD)
MNITLTNITPNPIKTIADAGRTCYKSKSSGLESDVKLIRSLIKMGHESVLEHASATFRISEVSRSLTHQLVRHRLCSFSQQSQRYVKEDQFDFVIPPSIIFMELDDESGLTAVDDYIQDMYIIQGMYDKWKSRGLKNEDARYVLPNACASEIVTTANLREWRTILKLRCDSHAQWEIRRMAKFCLAELYNSVPIVFEDLAVKYLPKPPLSFDEWYDEYQPEIAWAESGADREMDFDSERKAEEEYDEYLKTINMGEK